jgi:ferredoxin-NADP reductase
MRRQWLSAKTFELFLPKPKGFEHVAGQRLVIQMDGIEREYSIASAPAEPELRLCIRRVENGRLSVLLASCAIGSSLQISGATGYFVYQSSARQAVFVGTGAGIAPFHAMAVSGISGFILLHGVRKTAELLYRERMAAAAARYVACISGGHPMGKGCFRGRVTAYLQSQLGPGDYDFYLCGNGQMIRDVTLLIDERFAGSRVFSERFN